MLTRVQVVTIAGMPARRLLLLRLLATLGVLVVMLALARAVMQAIRRAACEYFLDQRWRHHTLARLHACTALMSLALNSHTRSSILT